jgi:uncharacterized protein (TIGR02172 family)
MIPLGTPLATGRTAEIFSWENGCILKLTRPEFPAHLADQEWRQAEAAWKLGAPAPKPMALVEVDGRRGVVFQHIEGKTMAQALQPLPLRLDHYARLLGRTHARLHELSAPGFPSLHGRIHWSLERTDLLSQEQKDAILGLLETLPDVDTLCHADFHPENILLSGEAPLVIDWEGSLHGEPAGDVAVTCLWIRTALTFQGGPIGWLKRQIGRRFEQVYLSAYRQAHGPLDHLPEWLAIHAACRINPENLSVAPYLRQIVRSEIPSF